MADPLLYTYESPLKGYENLEPLPAEISDDGKSYRNPPAAQQSSAYTKFADPVTNGIRGGFDIHIYFQQNSEYEAKYAAELWERIRREFPELRIYRLWDKPIGPHPIAMFEVNVFNPAQFGAFIPWLVIHRGPLSALVHPNTGDDYRDHTQRATWLGQEIPLHLRPLKEMVERKKQQAGL
ncbi:hypothetical protein C1H76_7721 [Elsinoe australis]|uniref:DOPA 4,5-dioxygenase n=1 Tax=Elsinoe australis TaxID=40998 RepID=A0A4U7AQ15_9PEZI|nr:hypothetical protein C1H76_7721 [Elsinoe australis]